MSLLVLRANRKLHSVCKKGRKEKGKRAMGNLRLLCVSSPSPCHWCFVLVLGLAEKDKTNATVVLSFLNHERSWKAKGEGSLQAKT